MGKNNRITEEQFHAIVNHLKRKILSTQQSEPGLVGDDPVEVDCDALLFFMNATSALYAQHCPGV